MNLVFRAVDLGFGVFGSWSGDKDVTMEAISLHLFSHAAAFH